MIKNVAIRCCLRLQRGLGFYRTAKLEFLEANLCSKDSSKSISTRCSLYAPVSLDLEIH